MKFPAPVSKAVTLDARALGQEETVVPIVKLATQILEENVGCSWNPLLEESVTPEAEVNPETTIPISTVDESSVSIVDLPVGRLSLHPFFLLHKVGIYKGNSFLLFVHGPLVLIIV